MGACALVGWLFLELFCIHGEERKKVTLALVTVGLSLNGLALIGLKVKLDAVVQQRDQLRTSCQYLSEQMQNVPRVIAPPPGISEEVLQAVLDIAWKYSMNGIESHRAGHILVVGDAEKLLKYGEARGGRGPSWACDTILVHSSQGHEDLMVEMNFDGCHVIHGKTATNGRYETGHIVAGRFFANQICQSGTGGAGAAAAQFLSTLPQTVAFKISQDGKITEYRNGIIVHEYCGPRSLGKKC